VVPFFTHICEGRSPHRGRPVSSSRVAYTPVVRVLIHVLGVIKYLADLGPRQKVQINLLPILVGAVVALSIRHCSLQIPRVLDKLLTLALYIWNIYQRHICGVHSHG